MSARSFNPEHFGWQLDNGVATITLDRPEKKNPLTFDSYAELRDTFRALPEMSEVRSVVFTGAGGNFCSGGDVHEIIGPLLNMSAKEQLEFTTMTGDLVIGIMQCPQVVIAAIDGVCVGAGACIAMACDMRFATDSTKTAFLFVRVGLAGCDMGACSVLPRIIGQGRAAELLYTGRVMSAAEGLDWGFFNQLHSSDDVLREAQAAAARIAAGPSKAHRMTKEMLLTEWDMNAIDAIEAEAVAQAQCMQTADFRRAYEAFVNRTKPDFQGD